MPYQKNGAQTMLVLLLSTTLALADAADDLVAQLHAWQGQRGIDTAPDIGTEMYRRALDGEIVKGIEVIENIKAAKGYGLAVFDIPIDQMWKAITDEDHHAGKLPVQISRTVVGTPRSHNHTLYQFMEVPLVTDRWWMVNIRYSAALYGHTAGKAWELTWQDRNSDETLKASLDPALFADGMPVAWTKGAWLLVVLDDGRTLVEYHTWSDPGGQIPVALATRFAAGEIAGTLKTMANFARSHTPSCSGNFHRPDGQAM
jgi:hypothetical protein